MTDEEFKDEFWRLFDALLIGGLTLRASEYPNGRPALQAWDDNWEPWATITVNLPDEALQPGEFFVSYKIRDLEDGWLLQRFEEIGLAHFTGRTVGAGFVERYAEVWMIASAWAQQQEAESHD